MLPEALKRGLCQHLGVCVQFSFCSECSVAWKREQDSISSPQFSLCGHVPYIYIYDSCKNLCKNSTDDFIPYYISVVCFFSKSILLSSIRVHMKNNWHFSLSYKYEARQCEILLKELT